MTNNNRKLNVYCSKRHYIDHLKPVWYGLPKKYRGKFFTVPELFEYCSFIGLQAEPEILKEQVDDLLIFSRAELKREGCTKDDN